MKYESQTDRRDRGKNADGSMLPLEDLSDPRDAADADAEYWKKNAWEICILITTVSV